MSNATAPGDGDDGVDSSTINWAERLGVAWIDDFFEDGLQVRQWALDSEMADPRGPNAGPARRARCSPEVTALFDQTLGEHLEQPVRTNVANFRCTTLGAEKALTCHTDWDLGDATAVVFLTRPEHCRGGTGFFRHTATGDIGLVPEHVDRYNYRDPLAWEPLCQAPMGFNRCVLFPAHRFHSVIPPFFGHSMQTGRLTLVSWFNFGTHRSAYANGEPG